MTTVVVADDDVVVAESIAELLNVAGFKAIPVCEVRELAARLVADPPDALLQDARMPGLDLATHVAWARSHPRLARVAIVLYTGSASVRGLRRALAVDGAVEKPASLDTLVAALAEAVRRRAAPGAASG